MIKSHEYEQGIRQNELLRKIGEELEKQNQLKENELELIRYWIDFEVKKYTDSLTINRITKQG